MINNHHTATYQMASVKTANFGSLVFSHLECDLHQTFIVSWLVGEQCVLQKIHKLVFEISCLQETITDRHG